MFKKIRRVIIAILVGIILGSIIILQYQQNKIVEYAIYKLDYRIETLQDYYNNLLNNDLLLLDKTITNQLKPIDINRIIKSDVFVRGFFGTGAGTVIKKTETSMYIITCAHVVEDIIKFNEIGFKIAATVGYVKKNNLDSIGGAIVYGAEVVKYDFKNDLALLKTSIIDDDLVVANLSDNEPEKGDIVFSVGSPLGLFRTISRGILSNKEDGFYFSDNTSTFGNSGGGLYNIKGELIGIPSNVTGYSAGLDENEKEIFVPETGLGLSISLFRIKAFLEGFKFDE